MRFLCVDAGERRTGLAIGDNATGIVTPLDVLDVPRDREAGAALLRAVLDAARAHGADALVVGLPLNMDGTEGPAARRTRGLGAALEAASGLPVAYQDERLTSAAADWSMARSGLTRGQKKQRRDAIAAAAILRDYLDSLRPPGPTPTA